VDLYTAPPRIKHIERNGGETGRIYRIISNPEKKKRKEIETIQEIKKKKKKKSKYIIRISTSQP
jgi:hypothetical protein